MTADEFRAYGHKVIELIADYRAGVYMRTLLRDSAAGLMHSMIYFGFLVLFADNVYDVPNVKVDYAMRNTHVPVGYWRSVNHSQNAYFRECFVDELAHARHHLSAVQLQASPQVGRGHRAAGVLHLEALQVQFGDGGSDAAGDGLR